jgi:hypothetical protein
MFLFFKDALRLSYRVGGRARCHQADLRGQFPKESVVFR